MHELNEWKNDKEIHKKTLFVMFVAIAAIAAISSVAVFLTKKFRIIQDYAHTVHTCAQVRYPYCKSSI